MKSFFGILLLHLIIIQNSFGQSKTVSPQIVIIDAVKMDYSIEDFTVKKGSSVEIHFSNKDIIKHNLLILKPGSLELVGGLADDLATSAAGVKSQWVPNVPEVLFYTPLLSEDEKFILKFKAPDKHGEYPFVCTYPTHWRMMNGVMNVE